MCSITVVEQYCRLTSEQSWLTPCTEDFSSFPFCTMLLNCAVIFFKKLGNFLYFLRVIIDCVVSVNLLLKNNAMHTRFSKPSRNSCSSLTFIKSLFQFGHCLDIGDMTSSIKVSEVTWSSHGMFWHWNCERFVPQITLTDSEIRALHHITHTALREF